MAQISTPSGSKSQAQETQPPAALDKEGKNNHELDVTAADDALPIEKTPTSPGAVAIQAPLTAYAKDAETTGVKDEISWVYPGASDQREPTSQPVVEKTTVSARLEADQAPSADKLQDTRLQPEAVVVSSVPSTAEPTRPAPAQDIVTIEEMVSQQRNTPDDVEGWKRLGEHVLQNQDAQAAFQILAEGVQHLEDPKQRMLLYRRMGIIAGQGALRVELAHLLEKENLQDEAETNFRAALRATPGLDSALDGLFRIYRAREALDRYEAILTRSLNNTSDESVTQSLLLRRAKLRFLHLERPDEALSDLQAILQTDPTHQPAMLLQEEILESTHQYEELIQAYQRRLPYCESQFARVDLKTAIAIIHENQLNNHSQAISYYESALADDPCHLPALDSLICLCEKRRDWLGAIKRIREIVQHQTNESLRCALHYRAGSILEEQLLRPKEAQQAYLAATQGSAPNPEALLALKNLARREQDWQTVIQLAERLSQVYAALDDKDQQVSYLLEIARIWRDRLNAETESLAAFEQVLSVDPHHVEATQALASHQMRLNRTEEAHALLAKLAQHDALGDLEPQQVAPFFIKLAQSAEALGKTTEAHAAYQKALQTAPSDPQLLNQFGYFLSRHEKWQAAIEVFGRIVQQQQSQLTVEEIADLYCHMALAYSQTDQLDQAMLHYQMALKHNANHLPALRAAIDLSQKLGRTQDSISLLAQLRSLSSSPTAQLNLSCQIGDLQQEQHRPKEAVSAYQQALAIEPCNVDLLEKLRRALIHAKQYQQAVGILQQLAELASTEPQKARYLRIAGDLLRERLDDDKAALLLYQKALDIAPLDHRAHASTVKILSQHRDYTHLAGHYEELLHRLPPPIASKSDRRIDILSELVELYRYRLNDSKRAIAACEKLFAIDQNQTKVQEDLAQLYEQDGQLQKAIQLHRALIKGNPFAIESYHALRRIYQIQGNLDATLCICSTLVFLDEADQDEQKHHQQYEHALAIDPTHQLTETHYHQLLLHPQAKSPIGELISFATDFCRSYYAESQRRVRFRSKDCLDLEKESTPFADLIRAAVDFLGLPYPEVYCKPTLAKGITAINTTPPALVYAEDAIKNATIPQLKFMIARAVAFTRPENLLATTLSAKQIRILLQALVEVASPSPTPPSEEVAQLAKKLKRQIARKKRGRLLQLADEYRAHTQDQSILQWVEGIEHTCNRAGLIHCGNLEAAVQVLRNARVLTPSGSPRTLIREMIFYSISEQHFELRRALEASI